MNEGEPLGSPSPSSTTACCLRHLEARVRSRVPDRPHDSEASDDSSLPAPRVRSGTRGANAATWRL